MLIFTFLKSLMQQSPISMINMPQNKPLRLTGAKDLKNTLNTFTRGRIFSEYSFVSVKKELKTAGHVCLSVLFIQLVEGFKSGRCGCSLVWALFCRLLLYLT